MAAKDLAIASGSNFVTDPANRSVLMSKIRSKNTVPELIVFADLDARGINYQKHYSLAPGRPDVACSEKSLAVFVDGDFWHGRDLARIRRRHGPDSPWAKKLRATMARDLRQQEELERMGWNFLRVWESDLKRRSTQAGTLSAIAAFLTHETDLNS